MMWRPKLPFLLIFILLFTHSSCSGQEAPKAKKQALVGGPCEGCEAIYEYGDKILRSTDTLPGFQENEPKLKVTGTIYQKDGTTPAENIILYIYHTNRKGLYQAEEGATGWAKRHGAARGWIKTGKDGKYTFYTFRPASYPNSRNPQHIHPTIKEPGTNEYYIDEYLFDDDPLLTEVARKQSSNRGGSGIVTPILENGIWTVQRDIILGKNIPNYE